MAMTQAPSVFAKGYRVKSMPSRDVIAESHSSQKVLSKKDSSRKELTFNDGEQGSKYLDQQTLEKVKDVLS